MMIGFSRSLCRYRRKERKSNLGACRSSESGQFSMCKPKQGPLFIEFENTSKTLGELFLAINLNIFLVVFPPWLSLFLKKSMSLF